MLTRILDEKKVSSHIRLKISAALAYFVVPYDIISEQTYGPMGFVDDIFLCSYILKDIKDDFGLGLLEIYWENIDPLEDVIEECYMESIKILEKENIDKIIKYVGLDYFDTK